MILGLIILSLFIKFEPYRLERIKVMLNPESDPMGIGYQAKQVMITIGSGGIFGLGLDQSQQKFGSFLPHAMSDSIFAVLAERAGFIGCFILIGLFIFFFWRCLKIAKLADDKFSRLFCVAVGSWIVLQAFVNIGAMIGMPIVGIPLPFISYGGSHIVSELIAVGILLNISKTREK
jgi:cell division protein FtsW